MTIEVNSMKNRIAQLRHEQKVTLRDVEEGTGVKNNTLSQYEHNVRQPKPETWETLATYFDVPVAYLMGLDDRRYSKNTLSWLHQYIDEQNHYNDLYNAPNINMSKIIGIVMDQCEAANLNILGDEDKTKALIDNAILMDVENADYTNSGSIEFFKNQLDNATRQLQLRYKNEPHENIDIDLLGDVFNETDKFKKNLDELKKKYPDDNKKDSQ